MLLSKKFRLFINGDRKGAIDYDTLSVAIAAANKFNEKMEGVM